MKKLLHDQEPNAPGIRGNEFLATINELRSTISQLKELRRRTWLHLDASSKAPWRKKLAKLLQSSNAHRFLITLLLIDLAVTATAILQTITNDSRDLTECTTLLESCQCTSQFEQTESWSFLQPISISILCILLLNVFGLLLAFGLSFFTHPGYILDLVVLPVAIFLEIYEDSEIGGLILILNLWRILMVAHSMLEVTEEAREKHLHEAEKKISRLQKVKEQDQEIMQQKVLYFQQKSMEKAIKEDILPHSH